MNIAKKSLLVALLAGLGLSAGFDVDALITRAVTSKPTRPTKKKN